MPDTYIIWKSRKGRNYMAVFHKNIGYTLTNMTKKEKKKKSSLEAKIFPNTEYLLWATQLCPKKKWLSCNL